MKKALKLLKISAAALLAAWVGSGVAATSIPTNFTNVGSIANTRHNLSQSTIGAGIRNTMDLARNDYGEVCVYCHTPHGANTNIGAAPLWNRTMKSNTYQTYNEVGTATLTQTVTQPGASSLTCLSCHDGTTAVDSILNMPTVAYTAGGGGLNGTANKHGYNAAQATTQNTTFLNSWDNPAGRVNTVSHMGLNSKNNIMGDGTGTQGCLTCHADTGAIGGATDFTVFLIGTDLRNDHPVGITFPLTGPVAVDFHQPNGNIPGKAKFFDNNNNGLMEKDEIRLYNTGQGPEVECASCHDPHGVPSAGVGSQFNATFLRVNQSQGSKVCLTCHNK